MENSTPGLMIMNFGKRYKYSYQRTPASLLILPKNILNMVSFIPDVQL